MHESSSSFRPACSRRGGIPHLLAGPPYPAWLRGVLVALGEPGRPAQTASREASGGGRRRCDRPHRGLEPAAGGVDHRLDEAA